MAVCWPRTISQMADSRVLANSDSLISVGVSSELRGRIQCSSLGSEHYDKARRRRGDGFDVWQACGEDFAAVCGAGGGG